MGQNIEDPQCLTKSWFNEFICAFSFSILLVFYIFLKKFSKNDDFKNFDSELKNQKYANNIQKGLISDLDEKILSLSQEN